MTEQQQQPDDLNAFPPQWGYHRPDVATPALGAEAEHNIDDPTAYPPNWR